MRVCAPTSGLRVLVTGSRAWPAELAHIICNALLLLPEGSVVVHGACPNGADALADIVCKLKGITVDPYPANWEEYGKSAGYKRNTYMVSLGADICFAFRVLGACNGTDHCVGQALKAGILVWGWSLDRSGHITSKQITRLS